MDIFKRATKHKLRFNFRGLISVEDLWDLDLEQLDYIFRKLNSEKKKENEESLLNNKSEQEKILDIKIEIVKHIFEEKKLTREKAVKAQENKEKRQKIMQIIAEKQNEDLKNKDVGELESMLEELGD